LKLDGQWETWLKKSETKDQNGKSAQIEGLIRNWHILAPFPFKRNDMFGQNNVVSCTVHKKKREKSQNGVVLNGTKDLLLPLDMQR